MKKAFTLLELIFVIVVIGILAAVIIPNTRTNPLQEAAVQLVSHIRYTQHLAMIDDKYDDADTNWYKNKWQIIFEETAYSEHKISYTIFADTAGGSSGNVDINEVAINPQDRTKKLTGGTDHFYTTDKEATASMNIGKNFGVSEVKVTGGGGTTTTAKRILFDNFGRPYKITNMTSETKGLAQSPIYIKLCVGSCSGNNDRATNNKELVIKIENETGYACILKENSNETCI